MPQNGKVEAPAVTKEAVCEAILDRADAIACGIAEGDMDAVVRGIWDAFHTKVPELLALLIAIGMVADDGRGEGELACFLYALKQRVSPGECYVWSLPHPAPRYSGWMKRRKWLPSEARTIAALRRGRALA